MQIAVHISLKHWFQCNTSSDYVHIFGLFHFFAPTFVFQLLLWDNNCKFGFALKAESAIQTDFVNCKSS